MLWIEAVSVWEFVSCPKVLAALDDKVVFDIKKIAFVSGDTFFKRQRNTGKRAS